MGCVLRGPSAETFPLELCRTTHTAIDRRMSIYFAARIRRMIVTARLRLRPFTPHDLAPFVDYRREPETARYQSWTPDFSEAQGRAFIDRVTQSSFGGPAWVNLVVEEIATRTMIGDVGLCRTAPDEAEIGFTFGGAHRRKGFAREAVGAVVQHAFDVLGIGRVVACIDARNEPASKLVAALGFREHHRDRDVAFKGERCDEISFERRRPA
jgi:RimJ/RimL family protein N-acetyltransferase